MSEHREPIPSMIYNAAIGGHVTNSQQIIDETENKEQSQINAEVKQTLGQGGSVDLRIANAVNAEKSRAEAAEEALDGRVDTLEEAVGTGGSVDSRIYNAVNAAKSEIKGNATSACDTLGEAETLISAEKTRAQTTEQLLQEQYDALTQSDIVVGTLPASGTKNLIYRVPGTNSYSDYMWNGTQFVKMAEYDNAIDDEPTAGSNNLVKSGGVFSDINGNTSYYSNSYPASAANYFCPAGINQGDKLLIQVNASSNVTLEILYYNGSSYISVGTISNGQIVTVEIEDVVADNQIIFLKTAEGAVNVDFIICKVDDVTKLPYKFYTLFNLNNTLENRISTLESNVEKDIYGEKLIDNQSHSFTAPENWVFNNVLQSNQRYYIKFSSDSKIHFKVVCETSSGYVTLLEINDTEWHYFNTPEISTVNLLLTYTLSSSAIVTVQLNKDGVDNNVRTIEDTLDTDFKIDQEYSYSGAGNKFIPGFINGELYSIQLEPNSPTIVVNIRYYDGTRYHNLMSVEDSNIYTLKWPDDCSNGELILNYQGIDTAIIRLRVWHGDYNTLKQYVRDLNIDNPKIAEIERDISTLEGEVFNSADYSHHIIVSANGTIGTDCDFTNIKSAIDSISDNAVDNRYLVFIKNGTYDISNDGILYLGLKDYVDIIGESIDGVQVIHRASASDVYKSCFDTRYYHDLGEIHYAKLSTMTLISRNCKGPFHSDYGGEDIAVGGLLELENLHLINENPQTHEQYAYGIGIAMKSGRTARCINCYGNVIIHTHNWPESDYHKKGMVFELINCNILRAGCKDLGSNSNDRMIIDGCTINTVFIGNLNDNVNNDRCSYTLEFRGDNHIGNVIPEPNQNWYTKYPFCVSGLHRVGVNNGTVAISKGDLVNMVYVDESQNDTLYNNGPWNQLAVKKYSDGYLYGIALDSIAVGEEGVIQYAGAINAGITAFSVNDYVKASSNGFVAATKSEADGIVTAINSYGTFIKLFNRVI